MVASIQLTFNSVLSKIMSEYYETIEKIECISTP